MVQDKFLPQARLAYASVVDVQHLSWLARFAFLRAQVVNRVPVAIETNLFVIPDEGLLFGAGGEVELFGSFQEVGCVFTLGALAIVPVGNI